MMMGKKRVVVQSESYIPFKFLDAKEGDSFMRFAPYSGNLQDITIKQTGEGRGLLDITFEKNGVNPSPLEFKTGEVVYNNMSGWNTHMEVFDEMRLSLFALEGNPKILVILHIIKT